MEKDSVTTIIFIRHGQTLWNLEGRVMGQLDSPLSLKGEQQARALAKRLREVEFDYLYSSDLGRAMQTAKLIADECGVSVIPEAGLRERNMGVFEGLTREEKKSIHADVWKACKAGGVEFIIPGGGESQLQRSARSIEVMERLAERHHEQTIVVVSHDGILRGFLSYVLDLDPAVESRITRANGSYNCFEKRNGVWRLNVWGDISHLRGID